MANNKGEKALSITSSREGFRRAGHTFGKAEVIIPVAKLSQAQIKLLNDEPLLRCMECTLPLATDN